jgi:hypothetical protein
MSLQSIILDNALVSSLYENIDLIDEKKLVSTIANPTEKIIANPVQPIKYLGHNKRGICIVVNYRETPFLPDQELTFLVTILQACKLTLEDVAIINYSGNNNLSGDSIKNEMTPAQLIVFGEALPAMLGLPDISDFLITAINGFQLLLAPELEALNNTTESGKLLKSKLWICLKQLFT